jgi:hypothetical protein
MLFINLNVRFLLIASLGCLSACTSLPPQNTKNICQIFQEKSEWYPATLNSARRWGIPIAVQMSIINQESTFVEDALPPRPLILGFIPWFRSSSAYGYAQAKDESWTEYQQNTGNTWADRDDFADSCDFVAWYCAISHKKLNIPVIDTKNLYLTYHEGMTGYQRKTYQSKPWLLNISQKVHAQALVYDQQLSGCRQDLEAK